MDDRQLIQNNQSREGPQNGTHKAAFSNKQDQLITADILRTFLYGRNPVKTDLGILSFQQRKYLFMFKLCH